MFLCTRLKSWRGNFCRWSKNCFIRSKALKRYNSEYEKIIETDLNNSDWWVVTKSETVIVSIYRAKLCNKEATEQNLWISYEESNLFFFIIKKKSLWNKKNHKCISKVLKQKNWMILSFAVVMVKHWKQECCICLLNEPLKIWLGLSFTLLSLSWKRLYYEKVATR